MLPRFAILIVTITCLSSMNLHAQYDAFVSINGIKSIDQPLETVILTENLATVDVILRDSGGGFLSDAFRQRRGWCPKRKCRSRILAAARRRLFDFQY